MGQRINIQYSVELDELDIEVARLFSQSTQDLEKAMAACEAAKETDILSLQAAAAIDTVRLQLAKADHVLQDTCAIINAYVAYKAQEAMVAAPSPEPENDIAAEAANEIAP